MAKDDWTECQSWSNRAYIKADIDSINETRHIDRFRHGMMRKSRGRYFTRELYKKLVKCFGPLGKKTLKILIWAYLVIVALVIIFRVSTIDRRSQHETIYSLIHFAHLCNCGRAISASLPNCDSVCN